MFWGPGPGDAGPGKPPAATKDFCARHSLADFRIHFVNLKDEFMAQKENLLDPLAGLDVCREPSLRHNKRFQKMMIGGTLPGIENPTFEEYIKAQVKLIEREDLVAIGVHGIAQQNYLLERYHDDHHLVNRPTRCYCSLGIGYWDLGTSKPRDDRET